MFIQVFSSSSDVCADIDSSWGANLILLFTVCIWILQYCSTFTATTAAVCGILCWTPITCVPSRFLCHHRTRNIIWVAFRGSDEDFIVKLWWCDSRKYKLFTCNLTWDLWLTCLSWGSWSDPRSAAHSCRLQSVCLLNVPVSLSGRCQCYNNLNQRESSEGSG